jgi:hypothetical protein
MYGLHIHGRIGLVKDVRTADRVGEFCRQSKGCNVAGDRFDDAGSAHVHESPLVTRKGNGTNGSEVVREGFDAIAVPGAVSE